MSGAPYNCSAPVNESPVVEIVKPVASQPFAFGDTVPSGHDPATDHLTGVFVASCPDSGGDGLPSLTGTDEVVLVPSA